MESFIYKVSAAGEKPGRGYRLSGPGLPMERVFRGDESRGRLEDIADLMNFAFEQGRRAAEVEHHPGPDRPQS